MALEDNDSEFVLDHIKNMLQLEAELYLESCWTRTPDNPFMYMPRYSVSGRA